MGFNKENLIVIPLTNALKKDFEATRQVFSEHNNITNVGFSYGIPGGIVAGDGVYLPQKQEMEFSSNMFMVDHNYLSTMKMKIIAGRDFSLKHITDESSAFIINETAVYNIGYEKPEDAIGESVKWSVWGTDDSVKTGKIIGVVEDFNFISLHNKISSTVLHLGSQYFQNLIVRVGSGDLNETVQFLEDQYRSFEPTRPFEPNFLDQTFAKFYESENKLSKLFTLFTVLAILTATIGLFGLVSFNIVSRSKEISIRKVLGASTGSIFNLLVKRYFVMMILCLLIAIPVAIIFANNWLENFAYRVDPSIWTFFNVSLATILLTFLTVTYQAIMGSRTNPADKLRNE